MVTNKKYETEETAQDIAKYFTYLPDEGTLWYRGDNLNTTKEAGEDAGLMDHTGYWRVSFKGRYYMFHRVCWCIYYGVWPKYTIDHIDMDPSNNRINNLRDIPQGENNLNRSKRYSKGPMYMITWREKQSKWRVNKNLAYKCIGEAIKNRNKIMRDRGQDPIMLTQQSHQ